MACTGMGNRQRAMVSDGLAQCSFQSLGCIPCAAPYRLLRFAADPSESVIEGADPNFHSIYRLVSLHRFGHACGPFLAPKISQSPDSEVSSLRWKVCSCPSDLRSSAFLELVGGTANLMSRMIVPIAFGLTLHWT